LIVEDIIGTIEDRQFEDKSFDYLHLDWDASHKRINRLTTDDGRELGLRLSTSTAQRGLRQGDVLLLDGDTAVVVDIKPADCLAVYAPDRPSTVRLAFEVGNRHTPLFFDNESGLFLLPYDEPLQQLLESIGLVPQRRQAKLLTHQRVGSVGGWLSAGHTHGPAQDSDSSTTQAAPVQHARMPRNHRWKTSHA
jgi:urease accessory protein